jgi:hypothetical protein
VAQEATTRFTCQNLPEMDNVSADFIEHAFDHEALGGFAVPWISHEVHLQAGDTPTETSFPRADHHPAIDDRRRDFGALLLDLTRGIPELARVALSIRSEYACGSGGHIPMSHTLSLSIRNAGGRSRIVIMEPWGREFALDVDEELVVTARPGSAETAIRVVEAVERTLIFAPGCFGVRVIKNGVTHNLALDAPIGTTAPQSVPTNGILEPMWDRDLDG